MSKKQVRTLSPEEITQLKAEREAIELENFLKENSKKNLKKKARQQKKNARLEQQRTVAALRATTAQAENYELAAAEARRQAAIAAVEDQEQRHFVFSEGVNAISCREAINSLNKLSARFPGEPLTITLNSPGGSVYAGLGLFDHIRELRDQRGHHITVKVRGMAASMGGILLQAGSERVVGPYSQVLIHAVSSGTIGEVNHMQDDLKQSKRLWKILSEILAESSSMTAEEVRKKAKKFDWWLTAEEAVALGFADRIG